MPRSRCARWVLLLGALLLARSAAAFLDPLTLGLATGFTTCVGAPVTYLLGCAFAYSPPVRLFGVDGDVYGLDWGSLACHAHDVYGLQLGFCGGSFEHRLHGLQLGILASGYAQQELPFGDCHFCNLDFCRMNGVQFGTFAAKTATANGLQASAGYAEAQKVNGLQFGLVTSTRALHGVQIGLFNAAERGLGLQIGLCNSAASGLAGCLPVLNLVY